MIDSFLAWHARQVSEHPRRVVGLLLIGSLVAAALLPRLEIESDLRELLPADEPSIRLLRALDTGDSTRTMLLLLRGEGLAEALPAIEAELRASPFLEAVDARREAWFGEPRAGSGLLTRVGPAVLEPLAAALQPAARQAAIQASKTLLAQDPVAGRELVLRDPLGLRWLLADAEEALLPPGLAVSSDYLIWPALELALVRVRGQSEPFDIDYSRELLEDLERRLAGRSFEALGGYDVARRDASRIRADMTRSLVWSIPLLVLVLAISTRSFWVPHVYVVPTLLAVLWALGFGGALLGPLTPLAVSSAAILMGLGIDFCIHYLDRYRGEHRRTHHAEAVLRAHRGTGRALMLGMATTVSAFLALSLGSFPGTRGFGLLLTLGLVGSWLAALSLLPLLARRLDPGPRTRSSSPVLLGLVRLVRSPLGRPLAVVGGLLALGGWLFALSGGLVFDADPGHMRPADQRFHQRVQELDAALGASPLGLRVLVPKSADPLDVASGLEVLVESGSVARTSGDLEAFPGAAQRAALTRFAAATEGWRAGADADLAAAGFRPELFRDTLDGLAKTLRSAPPQAPPASVEWEGRGYRSIVLHPPRTLEDAGQRLALRERVSAQLGDELLFVDSAGIGDTLGPLLAADLTRSLGACTLIVLLLVTGTLRSWRMSLAALLPVFSGLGITLGVLALSGFPLHPGNLLALPLILGLGVDDGIHMALRWHEGAGDPLTTTGRSIWRTTLTTVIGFGSLTFAASPAIASLGALAALGSVVCFLATVLGVPVILGRPAGERPVVT